MNQTIHFIKMHGVGNDYIFVDTSLYPIENPEAVSIAWSRYHFGIGSDGLVLIGKSPTPDADFTMRIFNADGSEGLMCGNASRCIGKYVYERGMTDKRQIRLMTASGIKTLDLTVNDDGIVERVTVDMLAPVLEDERLFEAWLERVPQARSKKAAELRNPKVRSQSLAAGALLPPHPAIDIQRLKAVITATAIMTNFLFIFYLLT